MAEQTPHRLVDPTALGALTAKTIRGYALHFVGLGLATAVGGALVALLSSKLALAAPFVLAGLGTIALGRYVGAHSAVVRRFAGLARTFWIVLAVALVIAVVAGLWEGHRWLGWITAAVGLVDGLAVGHLVNRAPQPTGPTTAPGN